MKLQFLIALTFTLSTVQAQVPSTGDNYGKFIYKKYSESGSVKEFIKQVPMHDADRSQIINALEMKTTPSSTMPLMQIAVDSKLVTYTFPEQAVELAWRIGTDTFTLNSRVIKVSANMKFIELQKIIKRVLNSKNAGVYSLLLPEAEAYFLLDDIAFLAIVGGLMYAFSFQTTCDKEKDKYCVIGLDPAKRGSPQAYPAPTQAQSFMTGHRATTFLCDERKMPKKIAGKFPIALKGMKHGPPDYNGDKPREVDLSYFEGKLTSFKLSVPSCKYEVDGNGDMIVKTAGAKECQVPLKMPARQFLAYVGVWKEDLEKCCQSSCVDEVQKMILQNSRDARPAAGAASGTN